MSQEEPTFQVLMSWQHRYRLKYRHPIPDRPGDGDATLHGPYEVRDLMLYWRWSETDNDWEVVTPVDTSIADYTAKRGRVCELADQHRGSMPPDELVEMLILASIETGIDTQPDIVDTVNFANADLAGFGEDLVRRVLGRRGGRDRTIHLWWIDEHKRYRAHK